MPGAPRGRPSGSGRPFGQLLRAHGDVSHCPVALWACVGRGPLSAGMTWGRVFRVLLSSCDFSLFGSPGGSRPRAVAVVLSGSPPCPAEGGGPCSGTASVSPCPPAHESRGGPAPVLPDDGHPCVCGTGCASDASSWRCDWTCLSSGLLVWTEAGDRAGDRGPGPRRGTGVGGWSRRLRQGTEARAMGAGPPIT